MTTTKTTPGPKGMTAEQLLELAAANRKMAETAPAWMRRSLLQRAALRERQAAGR